MTSEQFLRNVLEKYTHKFVFRRHLCAPFDDVTFYATTEGGLKFIKSNLTNLDPILFNLASK